MVELLDCATLCMFTDKSVNLLSESCSDDCLVLTQNQQRISVYSVSSGQLICNWFVKAGQRLTSPAVSLPDGLHYAVILDEKILQTWKKEDDKPLQIMLPKPACQLFPLENETCLVLFNDGTMGTSRNLTKFWGQAADYRRLVWSGALTIHGLLTVVAVFELGQDVRKVIRYSLAAAQDTVEGVEFIQEATSGSDVTGYCLQLSEKDVFLVTIYSDGRLGRTLVSSHNPVMSQPELTLASGGATPHFSDVIAIDASQVAVVRNDEDTAFVEIWDTKYCTRHSQLQVDLKEFGRIQHLRCHKSTLLLICDLGVCLIPYDYQCSTLSLASKKGKTSSSELVSSICQSSALQSENISILQNLADKVQTPSYDDFKKEFARLMPWLKSSKTSYAVDFCISPLVDSVVERVFAESDTLWPVEELKALLNAGLISNSEPLFTAAVQHDQFDLLHLCLTKVKDISEPAIVTSLQYILRRENAEFSKFGCTREQLLGLVLSLPYNEDLLAESMGNFSFSLALDLLKHLHVLQNSNDVHFCTQVLNWMSFLIVTYSKQCRESKECLSLLPHVLAKVDSEISACTKSKRKRDEAELQEIRNRKRHHGYYITTFSHPFDD